MSTVGIYRTAVEEGIFQSRVNDLSRFTALQLHSTDIDPVYPILRHIIEARELGEEQAFWLVSLYLAFYSLPSALATFEQQPWPGMPPLSCLSYPTGIERRGLRDVRCMQAHLEAYLEHVGVHGEAWAMEEMWPYDAGMNVENFHVFWDRAQSIAFNGRWAAFKWTELLVEVLGYPFTFPDMRLESCSGPREGLQWLYSPAPVSTLNKYAEHLAYELSIRGHRLSWEQLETMLCNFNSMRKGKYYAGHDIDEMQDQILKAEAKAVLREPQASELFKARSAVIPHAYLGEWSGWRGVQRERMALYQRTGVVHGRP